MRTTPDPFTFICGPIDAKHFALDELALRPRALHRLPAGISSRPFALQRVILKNALDHIAILLVDELAWAAFHPVLPHARVDSIDSMVGARTATVGLPLVPLATICELVLALDLAQTFH